MIAAKETKRKFYNKWLYRITVHLPGASIMRMKSFDQIIELLSQPQTSSRYLTSTYTRAYTNKAVIVKLINLLSTEDQLNWAKRIEAQSVDIYTNSVEFYNKLSIELEDVTSSRSEPDISKIDLLENTSCIFVKKLPHNKYKYKVFLLPHKLHNDKEAKTRYLNWIASQGDRILISDIVKTWFLTTSWNWDRRYLHVEDSNTLLMLKLRNLEVIGSVYEYILDDK